MDRLFHDESARVKHKSQKAQEKAIAAREEREHKAKARVLLSKPKDVIELPLLCPLIDQGITFFMNNYTIGMDQPPIRSDAYHRYVSTYGFHPLIATSMTALGLAGVANLCRDASMKREAMHWYLNAIQMTNAALASPTEVKSDNTLLATMLLSTFEATSNDESLEGWSNHVDGSASLLRMRGMKQFSTPAGRRMFVQTVGLLTMNCMGKGVALPEYVHAMNREFEKHQDERDPGYRFYHLHIDAVDLRAQILSKRLTSLEEIVERALALDQVAKAVFDDVYEHWKYAEVRGEDKMPGVFAGYYHIYPHMAAAQTWNWVRFNRIYLHDMIRNCLISGFSTAPPVFAGMQWIRQLEESTETLYRMQADILASFPQYLHDTPKSLTSLMLNSRSATPEGSVYSATSTSTSPSPSSTASFSTAQPAQKFLWANFLPASQAVSMEPPGSPTDRLPIVRISGGYSSLWALYVAGAMPMATLESQRYILACFQRVSSEFGINQAKVLAGVLRVKMRMDREGEAPFSIVPDYLPTARPEAG